MSMKPLRPSTTLVLGSTLSGLTFALVRSQLSGVPTSTSDLLVAFGLGIAVGLFLFGSARIAAFAWAHLTPSAKRKGGLFGLALLALLGICRLAVPCTLNGNWVGPTMTAHLFDSHCFVHFADGRATNYHDGARPKDWGSYSKVGWNTYAWKIPGNQKPITIRVGWLFLHGRTEEAGIVPRFWGWRDLQIRDCARIIRETQALPPKPENARAKHE